jgi:hypothetical protein
VLGNRGNEETKLPPGIGRTLFYPRPAYLARIIQSLWDNLFWNELGERPVTFRNAREK